MKRDHGENLNTAIGSEMLKFHPLIIREFTGRLSSSMREGILTMPQIVILDLISEKGSRNMSEIAHALNLTMGAATGIIDRMIELKVAKRERSAEDRRVVNVYMDDKGKEAFARLNTEKRNVINKILSPLTNDEKKEYLRILRKIHNHMKKAYEQK